MPVNWNADKDQFLLIQLIEDLRPSSTQLEKIIDTWPSKLGEAPTRRAITEHLVKLRATFGKAGIGNFKATGAKGIGSNASTPKTPRKNAIQTPSSGSGGKGKAGGKKRKRGSDSETDAEMTDDSHCRVKAEHDQTEDGVGDNEVIVPRETLMRSTKSPEKRKQQTQYIKQEIGESSDDDGASDAGPGEEDDYTPIEGGA